uniref:60S acidic ribosomal protein P2 n=1 Tax=Craspedostauros australis TaxID=1486917 RepID=A0A7R9ZND5_9STRA|mmetsp:Transcript_22540/g.62890  ORF Transcript_22540/g.62890 Transcript_22540/m.62890 type:complete len:118 (+) Transcript_22540:273-626(+)|eukprot:CAMPEP_0198111918 /NCGR_PEP_ID=MMETSP1442-20131203/3835_1 /TAXON_ID= /ORGANISM="Craspedostauros australis, Strain CCMP3328" /LENGTH=117 /DNA_ID=CAMNT_0043768527 /DNA_START=257 /DNA_END=610 /DNA_ORIENTATION=-
MKHMAVYLLCVLGGKENPTKDDISKAMSTVGLEADDASVDALLTALEGKDLNELLESGKGLLAKIGGGGGGGGGAAGGAGGDAEAEEEKEEEKVEEEEMDLGGGMDMFGGDEGGGDY